MVLAQEIQDWFMQLQDAICHELESLDGSTTFHQDLWEREGGGGGRTRIIEGDYIEKGGVNFSAVHGAMPDQISKSLGLESNHFLATGVSIVLHPSNPWVPIIHMNVRYFETDTGHWWFGGGIDVTPHYINTFEASEFHKKLKSACDKLGPETYKAYKEWADNYFYNQHRQETRGIGGIFFDRLNESSGYNKMTIWNFVKAVGEAFVPCYRDLFIPNYQRSFEVAHQEWQKVRRGRYVEFNLVYDRGTKFGLQTNGRIESILMSMPPEAIWQYNRIPQTGSDEEQTLNLLQKGIDWINLES